MTNVQMLNRSILVAASFVFSWISFVTPPVLRAEPSVDGTIDGNEWAGATSHPLVGGGDILLLEADDAVYVAVRGSRRGVASVCVGDDRRVSILHSSAALGTAEYARNGDRWHRTTTFEYEVRDSPRSGPPSEPARRGHMERWAWLSNPSHEGAPAREFVIERTPDRRFLGVAFMTIGGEASEVAYWPEEMRDDCAALRLVQGWADEHQVFAPERWYRLKGGDRD